MVIAQADVWWADLAEPIGSSPGYRRPIVVVQSDPLNQSDIATVVGVALTTNLRWSAAPGNVLLTRTALAHVLFPDPRIPKRKKLRPCGACSSRPYGRGDTTPASVPEK
jgi:mRNA-degrading endonuclease toxin of MazEF toxin-antitoxin module